MKLQNNRYKRKKSI